jgi:hypothetical protein
MTQWLQKEGKGGQFQGNASVPIPMHGGFEPTEKLQENADHSLSPPASKGKKQTTGAQSIFN